jgi:hypothetical protein
MYPTLSSSKKGFTFVEMLITAAMLSLVGLAIFATLNNGISIWQQLNQAVGQEDINIFFERIARELRNSFEFETINFQGGTDRLSFATFVTTIGSSLPQEMGIGEVSYIYDEGSDLLIRQKRNYTQIYQGEEGFAQWLLKDIASLKFSYYFYDADRKEYFWQEEWLQEGLPLAVRIELESKNGQETERIIRTIDIPASQFRKQS